jgi:hypothetical protein
MQPLDRALRRAAQLRAELSRSPEPIEIAAQPSLSGIVLRADYRSDDGARAAAWHSVLGFDRAVAEVRFTLRAAPERWADPIVPTLVAKLGEQAACANLTPPPEVAALRDYRIDGACVIGIPADWGLHRDEGEYWFYAPGESPKFSIVHHWSELPSRATGDAAELGLALAYDLQATLRRNRVDSDVEAGPLGGLVTTFSADGLEEAEPGDDPPLAVTGWYYLIPVGERLLTMIFGLLVRRAMEDEPWVAALPGQFRQRIAEIRLAAG